MMLRDLTGKNICILGFGREGRAMLKAIQDAGIECSITIADQKSEIQSTKHEAVSDFGFSASNLQWHSGNSYLKHLDRFDVIIRSPGIFPCSELEAVQNRITNSTQIFLDEVTSKNATVIGVTGSKGKSTTASLIYEILKAGGKNVTLVGNIGEPAIGHVKDASANKYFVQEMSSYQLMNMESSPKIAVVTSFFPEHLDYHSSASLTAGGSPLEEYREAKTHISKFQDKDDVIFFNANSEGAIAIAQKGEGKKIQFTSEDAPIDLKSTKLIGIHNLSNIAAAFLVGKHFEIPDDVSIKAIQEFQSLPHRLQPCGEHHGINWVDDAISTTPESTIAAIDALGDKISTLILGGKDRGNDFTELAQRIAHSDITNIILLGESGKRIQDALNRATALVNTYAASTMEEVVALAKDHTTKGKTCLLSPASPSYDMFKNFEERGEAFLHCILQNK